LTADYERFISVPPYADLVKVTPRAGLRTPARVSSYSEALTLNFKTAA